MVVVGIFIGYWVGKLLLGGLYYSLFTNDITPNSPRGKRIESTWAIFGIIIGIAITV
jgi:hypothetical protein